MLVWLIPIIVSSIFFAALHFILEIKISKLDICDKHILQLKEVLGKNDAWLEEIKDDPRKGIEAAFMELVRKLLESEREFDVSRSSYDDRYVLNSIGEKMRRAHCAVHNAFPFLIEHKLIKGRLTSHFHRSEILIRGNLTSYFDRARAQI